MLPLIVACTRLPPEVTTDPFTATFGDDDDDDEVPSPTGHTGVDPCAPVETDATGAELAQVLNEATSGHFCNDYPEATTFLFVSLDAEDGLVECVYTGRTTSVANGQKPDESDMNTEHTWPRSLGADKFPAECDLHHLYPTDSATNALRGNLPFGGVVTETEAVEGGSRYGLDAQGTLVFEPRDEHKGNVARSLLYFAMRYELPLQEDEALLQAWSAADPVDDRELARTLAICARQGAPNPYVLTPSLVDRL